MCQYRAKYNLTSLRPSSCARYLLGISLRFQQAIASAPYISKLHQAWTQSALVVLTGIPKDFLMSINISSPDQLLQSKTKDVAYKFIEWRNKSGMPELRGSGPVAFISGWKTSVKEAIEAENSLSFSEGPYSDIMNHSSEGARHNEFPDYNPIDSGAHKSASPHSNGMMMGPMSLKHILSAGTVNFLLSVGIRTVFDLRNVEKGEKSEVVRAMIAWKKRNGMGAITPSQCVNLLYGWERRASQAETDNRVARYTDPRKINVNMHPLRHVLKKASILRFLSSVGIYTAKDLYKCDKRYVIL